MCVCVEVDESKWLSQVQGIGSEGRLMCFMNKMTPIDQLKGPAVVVSLGVNLSPSSRGQHQETNVSNSPQSDRHARPKS